MLSFNSPPPEEDRLYPGPRQIKIIIIVRADTGIFRWVGQGKMWGTSAHISTMTRHVTRLRWNSLRCEMCAKCAMAPLADPLD